MKNVLLIAFASLFFAGCNGVNPLTNVVLKTPPHTKYIRSLEQANLRKTTMAQAWVGASEKALYDSIIVTLPFSESGYFIASEPAARSYRFDVRKGQVLTVTGNLITKNNATVFLDLFHWEENKWTSLAHGDSAVALTHEFDRDEKCLIRLQPELLVTAYYTISISLTPVLINPVAGATNKSIRSFYGDSRDGGKRKHEGVDIFAKKGTPVIAPTSGYVTRVGTGKLGGKVVWMQDQKRRHSYYFAHLDEQLVKAGTKVSKGDTLGTVGNTGNARYTPSHLHFGIYQNRSLDPVHFIRTLENNVHPEPWDTTQQQYDYKVIAKNAVLRTGPIDKAAVVIALEKNNYVQIIAQSAGWFRIQLPDERQGFIEKNKITAIQKGKKLRIRNPMVVLSEIHPWSIPLKHLTPPTSVEILATFDKFKYVRTDDGVFGWLMI
jgi:peptidoglycan LD-endopeptidase LytH